MHNNDSLSTFGRVCSVSALLALALLCCALFGWAVADGVSRLFNVSIDRNLWARAGIIVGVVLVAVAVFDRWRFEKRLTKMASERAGARHV